MPARRTIDKEDMPDTEATEPTAANEERISVAKRRIFVTMRLAELQDRIKSFAAEREELSKHLDGRGGQFSPDLKRMRERRTYTAMRLETLRAEQKALAEEKKTLD